jgi:transposase
VIASAPWNDRLLGLIKAIALQPIIKICPLKSNKKMTNNQCTEAMGIDISKSTLDAALQHRKLHMQFENSTAGFKSLFKWISKLGIDSSQLVICFEHTGWYCLMLSHYLYRSKIPYHCVNPLEIKRSIGFKRGKSDKSDAFEIARYAWLHREELIPSIPLSERLIELQRLMSLREQLVKQSTALKNQRQGMKVLLSSPSTDACIKVIDQMLHYQEKQIKVVEKTMLTLIKEDQELEINYKLSRTVKGVGPILGIQMLLHTHNYTRFLEWRQFSAYCGLVPYLHESGTSIKGRPKIHPISDRKMKSLLSMSAISAIQCDAELKLYYNKRVEEGKPKMVVLNIIRNKLVARIFATIKRGTPFVPIHKFAA